MNLLWTRMKKDCGRSKEKIEGDRREAEMMVGENLVCISNLKGVDKEKYKAAVLPRIAEVVLGCKDAELQQYLMDAVVQAFPDDFHLYTLEDFLGLLGKLSPEVAATEVLRELLRRLTTFAASSPDALAKLDTEKGLMKILTDSVARIIDSSVERTPLLKILDLCVSFLHFVTKAFPNHGEHINFALDICSKSLQLRPAATKGPDELQSLFKLLVLPIGSMGLGILTLSLYPDLMSKSLPTSMQHTLSLAILNMALLTGKKQPITSPESAEKLAKLLIPLRGEPSDLPKLLHSIRCPVLSGQLRALKPFKDLLCVGMRPAFVWELYRLGHQLAVLLEDGQTPDGNESSVMGEVYDLAYEATKEMIAGSAIALLLQGVVSMGHRSALESYAEKYMIRAMELYEDEIADSDARFRGLTMMIGCMVQSSVFSDETYTNLAQRVSKSSVKLLKKSEQCKAVLMCSHMYWAMEQVYRSGEEPSSSLKSSS
ncbi:MAG: hypothetical protein P4M11_03155 [Candidatus Pacebacteria bacterium]|nr:hypothetical protein [Candidatus Paceibacterota bacterium]